MVEQRDTYFISSSTINGLVNDLNQIFSRIADRLDRVEGIRENPTFWSEQFIYKNQKIRARQVLQVNPDNETATFADAPLADNLTDKTANETITGLWSFTLSPIFSSLTASRLVSSDSVNKLSSVDDLTDWIAGTTNQITVADDSDGTVTISTPQDISTTSDVTFNNMVVSGYTTSVNLLVSGETTLSVLDGSNTAVHSFTSTNICYFNRYNGFFINDLSTYIVTE